MKVRFRQTGGFAGLIRGCELDSADLPQKEAAQLDRLSRQSPGAPRSSTGAARDLTSYEVTVETPEGSKVFSFDDLGIPEGAAPLIELLRRRCKPLPPA